MINNDQEVKSKERGKNWEKLQQFRSPCHNGRETERENHKANRAMSDPYGNMAFMWTWVQDTGAEYTRAKKEEILPTFMAHFPEY